MWCRIIIHAVNQIIEYTIFLSKNNVFTEHDKSGDQTITTSVLTTY